jgi:hypothetical protein
VLDSRRRWVVAGMVFQDSKTPLWQMGSGKTRHGKLWPAYCLGIGFFLIDRDGGGEEEEEEEEMQNLKCRERLESMVICISFHFTSRLWR